MIYYATFRGHSVQKITGKLENSVQMILV